MLSEGPLISAIQMKAQNEVFQREISGLRKQCISLQGICADLQRQLDASSIAVTEGEQRVIANDFEINQVNNVIYLFIYYFIYFIYLFIYLFVYLFIYYFNIKNNF